MCQSVFDFRANMWVLLNTIRSLFFYFQDLTTIISIFDTLKMSWDLLFPWSWKKGYFPFSWNFLITLPPKNRSWDTHLQEANPLSHVTSVPFELMGLCVTEFQSELAHSTLAVILHSCLLHFFPNTNTHLKFCALNNEVAFVDSCCLWVCLDVLRGGSLLLSSPNVKIGT